MQQVYGGQRWTWVFQVTFQDRGNSQESSGVRRKEFRSDFSRGAKINGIYYAKTVLRENLSA